jgi:hypothetical protein
MHNFDCAVLEAQALVKQGVIEHCGIESYYGFDSRAPAATTPSLHHLGAWALSLFQNGPDHPLRHHAFRASPFIQAVAADVESCAKNVPGELRILLGDGSRLMSVTRARRFRGSTTSTCSAGRHPPGRPAEQASWWGHAPASHFVTRFA